METEKRITTSQLFALIFILGIGFKMLMLPVLLLKSCGRDSLIITTVNVTADLICLAVMLLGIKFCPRDCSFFDILKSVIGKWGAKILCAILATFFLFKMLLILSEINSFVSENLLKEYSSPLYALPLYAVCVVMGMGSLRSAGRTVQFMFPIVAVTTLMLIMLIASGVDFGEVLPLGEFSAKTVAKSTFGFAVWDGDFSVLIIVLGSVKKNKTVIAGITSGVIAALTVVFYIAGLTAAYSNVCYVIRFGQSISGMSHYAMGNVMQGRIDLVLFCGWILSAMLKVGVYSFASVTCAANVVNIKPKWISLVWGVIAAVVLSGLNLNAEIQTFAIYIMPVPAVIIQFGVPVISLVSALVLRRRDRGSDGVRTDETIGKAIEREATDI